MVVKQHAKSDYSSAEMIIAKTLPTTAHNLQQFNMQFYLGQECQTSLNRLESKH